MLRVGIDIGGTFTDLFAMDEASGEILAVKVPSTPRSPSGGALQALKQLSRKDLSSVVHASTIATNVFLGQMGLELPKAALLATEGFKDVIEIGRQKRQKLYDLFFEIPKSLINKEWRFDVRERISHKGEVIVALDEPRVKEIAKKLKEKGIGVVAISFLHSYVNPDHEKKAREIILEEFSDTSAVCVCSHEMDPEYREYERTSTTLINALLIPVVSDYLNDMERKIKEMKVREGCRFYAMQSNGGMTTFQSACLKPAAAIESGPSAGVMSCALLARNLNLPNVLTFDMGGTTAKTGAIFNFQPDIVTEYEVGGRVHSGRIIRGSGYPVRHPFLDLAEVSSGGGTIAWIDKDGSLKVGPISAGAEPGPVCYGKGGDDPTVTDANLVLGRLSSYLLGREMELRRELAEKQLMEKIAKPLTFTLEEASSGIIKLCVMQMAYALRIVSLERGYDPRDFVLVAFGGAGPLHCCYLADELGITNIIVPPNSGLFSALGLIVSDIRRDYLRSVIGVVDEYEEDSFEESFRGMEIQAKEEMKNEGLKEEEIVILRQMDIRYFGQSYEIIVPYVGLTKTVESFHDRHRDIYGYSSDKETVEIINLRITAIGKMGKLSPKSFSVKDKIPLRGALIGKRNVYFDNRGWVETNVFRREGLNAGNEIPGPAVIEQYDSTVLVPPDWKVDVDRFLHLMLTKV